jgi:hypothetical protein
MPNVQKKVEKILSGPHKYENGSYVSTPYIYQEYPKTMDGTGLPPSIVNSKAEEIAWIRKRRRQRIKNALRSLWKAIPHFFERLGVIVAEAFFRAKT